MRPEFGQRRPRLFGKNHAGDEACHGNEQERPVADFVGVFYEFVPLQAAAKSFAKETADKPQQIGEDEEKAVEASGKEMVSFLPNVGCRIWQMYLKKRKR